MNIIKIVCPQCGAEKKLSLVDTSYSGPQRCWKCHQLYSLTIYNNQIRNCEPLTEEAYQQQQEKKGGAKAGGGQAEPEISLTPERKRDYSKSLNYGTSSGEAEPGIQFTPERKRDYSKPVNYGNSSSETGAGIQFTPVKPAEPEQQAPTTPSEKFNVFKEPATLAGPEKPRAKAPPEKFNTFVPLETAPPAPKKEPKKKVPDKPVGDRVRTFIPLEDDFEEPKKEEKPKEPPEKFNIFIPPAE